MTNRENVALSSVPETRNVAEIIFRPDLYPRLSPNPSKIIEYSENIDQLPPIEINQDLSLIHI